MSSDDTKLNTVLSLWKTPDTRQSSRTAAAGSVDSTKLVLDLNAVRQQMQTTTAKVQATERRADRHDSNHRDLVDRLQRSEGDVVALKGDLSHLTQQLEQAAVKHEVERSRVSDQQEQIKYLTAQVTSWRHAQLSPTQATYWAMAGWVYVPLLHLLRGMWVIVHPLLATLQHLTLFGFTPAHSARKASVVGAIGDMELQSAASVAAAVRTSADVAAMAGSISENQPINLLQMLQSGALDPKRAAKTK
jgi:hypothetical protein